MPASLQLRTFRLLAAVVVASAGSAVDCPPDWAAALRAATKLPQTEVCDTFLTIAPSTEYKNPLWSAYTLRFSEQRVNKGGRESGFRRDGRVPDEAQTDRDAQVWGKQPRSYDILPGKSASDSFDRGHLAPSFAHSYDLTGRAATYVMTNVAPQTNTFNQQGWRMLEEHVTDYVVARRREHVRVVTGTAYTSGADTIFVDGTALPTHYFKIISDGGYCVAFVGENTTEYDLSPQTLGEVDSTTPWLTRTLFSSKNDLAAALGCTADDGVRLDIGGRRAMDKESDPERNMALGGRADSGSGEGPLFIVRNGGEPAETASLGSGDDSGVPGAGVAGAFLVVLVVAAGE